MAWVKIGPWEFRLEDVRLLRHFEEKTQSSRAKGQRVVSVTLANGESFQITSAERDEFLAQWERYRATIDPSV